MKAQNPDSPKQSPGHGRGLVPHTASPRMTSLHQRHVVIPPLGVDAYLAAISKRNKPLAVRATLLVHARAGNSADTSDRSSRRMVSNRVTKPDRFTVPMP